MGPQLGRRGLKSYQIRTVHVQDAGQVKEHTRNGEKIRDARGTLPTFASPFNLCLFATGTANSCVSATVCVTLIVILMPLTVGWHVLGQLPLRLFLPEVGRTSFREFYSIYTEKLLPHVVQ